MAQVQRLPPSELCQQTTRWLFKSEPDVRYENGKDVSFSIDRFEQTCAESSTNSATWDGVRNGQASGFMKKWMKVGHRGLFYHSSCAVPGVAGLAEICKESYPDHTAFDSSSPYYDPKSTKDSPRWYMVNVRFLRRLPHFVPLAVLQKFLPDGTSSLEKQGLRKDVAYLSDEQVDSIASMPLLMPGRLSVQPVPELAYEAIVQMGEEGGFEHWIPAKGQRKKSASKKQETAAETEAEAQGREEKAVPAKRKKEEDKEEPAPSAPAKKAKGKKQEKEAKPEPSASSKTGTPLRRSGRNKRT